MELVIFVAVVLEQILEQAKNGWNSIWTWVSWGVGILFSWVFHIDILSAVGHQVDAPVWAIALFSGLVLGSGAGFLHDVIKGPRNN